MSMFSDLAEEVMEIFMDDFTVYGSNFEHCLQNLGTVLHRCQDKNLALNWEKCHFMGIEGIVLGHRIYAAGLEVDQAKVSIIKTLLPPTTVKGIRSFLGHASFYRRFTRDFSKIERPLCRLLEKDAKFNFNESYQYSFKEIKSRLVEAPIMAKPDWNKEFEIMCDVVTIQWELYWDRKLAKCLGPYTIPAKPSMKLKRITQLLKRRCWLWYLHVKSSGHIYWGPTSLSILIMLQSNI